MVSLLIPTYNYDVVSLVKSLYKQLKKQEISFEIICFDNGSKSKVNLKNEQINDLDYCVFVSLKKNGGRSKIRNLLADKAAYDWLLFLDADVLPVSEKFIKIYLDSIRKENQNVVYGGLKYVDNTPPDDEMLRWVYGKDREEIPLKERVLSPDMHFASANFLIEKSLFQQIKFDESLVEYGHEDTLLALNLKKKKIPIHQIDNPVYHLGLDKSKLFIVKTKKSIENLMYLQNQQKIGIKDNRLLKRLDHLKKMKLNYLFSFLFKKLSRKMEHNLCSKRPSIFIYDLYKLGYICLVSKE